MTVEAGFWRKASTLLKVPTDRFVALVDAAGVNRGKAFRYGDLRGCDLRDEDLRGFDFSHADFSRANLVGADLSGTSGLDTAILDDAIWDATTRWPCPDWADAAGRDEYGPWASFTIKPKAGTPVTMRLRWCPPGRFQMGSPDTEEGRYDDEGPVQTITFVHGFWMFETPCTKALWVAVMGGKSPSQFKSPDRPVDTVSHRDAIRFIERLNRMKPRLGLALPSEARWEYACRAGSTEPTYGPSIHAELAEIAWFAVNSGGGTHPVGKLRPNRWGLHDMLGNVWEWCGDAWRESHENAAPDGAPRVGAAERVIRGGSWNDQSRYVRAACRDWLDPDERGDLLGFRCVRGPFVSPASGEPRAAGRGKQGSRSGPAAASGRARRRAGGT
jgi:formylglycine-generating enzyme required for sulfatase activity